MRVKGRTWVYVGGSSAAFSEAAKTGYTGGLPLRLPP
jgi:hypothetical protein